MDFNTESIKGYTMAGLSLTKAVVKDHRFQLIATAVTTGTAGYILGKRNGDVFVLESDVVEDRIDELVRTFPRLTPEELDAELAEDIIEEEEYTMATGEDFYDDYELESDALQAVEEDELMDAEPASSNIFESNAQDWDYETELALRSSDEPYTIHVDEYTADEAGCDQRTVVFYNGDRIVADEADNPIYGWEQMMGELNFGHGSNDSSVVYIRNERLMMEWEVLFHSSSFEVEVNGLEIEAEYEAEDELRHSRYANSRLAADDWD